MTCLVRKLENVLLSTLKVCLSVDGNHNQLITDECSPHHPASPVRLLSTARLKHKRPEFPAAVTEMSLQQVNILSIDFRHRFRSGIFCIQKLKKMPCKNENISLYCISLKQSFL